MAENFDLLGDPIPDGWNQRGRPAHIATEKNRNKVIMLLAFGWKDERIAHALGITPPTLRKHYFSELRVREEARDRLDATLAYRMLEGAMSGNVGAAKEFSRIQERIELYSLSKTLSATPTVQKPEKLGKKQERMIAAQKVVGKFAPPEPPRLVISND